MKTTLALLVSLTTLAAASCKRAEQPVTGSNATSATQTQPQPDKPPEPANTNAGSPMPEYAALNLDGSKFDLAMKRDKVVLLNVWATWCGPCRYEIPELQRLHEQYASRGLEVIGVSVDESGAESVRTFIGEQEKMTYPIVLDAEGKIANILETTVLPTSIVVNRNGRIVWKKYGAIMEGDGELKKAIEGAL